MLFQLDKDFVDSYRAKPVAFGWGGLGEVVFYRTYSRADNPNAAGRETWADVCERVINGMYTFQQSHFAGTMIGQRWNEDKAQRSAREAFDLMFNMRWTPPGRGLWMMGTDFVMGRGIVEALQNCAFVSTAYLAQEGASVFSWLMEMSMLGVGVGFDTRGAGLITIKQPIMMGDSVFYAIADTRQGWAKSVEVLINAYFTGAGLPVFDYTQIRPKGAPIAGFGGVASGPAPLMALHGHLVELLDAYVGRQLDSTGIVDICNRIGCCVVAGNVRRSAEIAFGSPDDAEFIDLKNYRKNPKRADYGWVSNNSVMVQPGDDYEDLAKRTWANGEPGYFWIDNARQYGRMNGQFDFKDNRVMGGNPCMEQMLHHREMCTLVEIYLPRCRSKEEFGRAIKYAYLYGKSVTLGNEQIADDHTRDVMTRNRRIGLSVTGVTQFLGTHGVKTLIDWFDYGYQITDYYDRLYSQWLGVVESIRKTSVKPSGTVSLVVGVTPGIHFNVTSRFHIRRVDIADNSPLVDPLIRAGYPMEPSVYTPGNLSVMFPVDAGPGVRSEADVSVNEQLGLIALAQKYWADNAVSATVKFNRNDFSADDLAEALRRHEAKLKGISFLPIEEHGYAQAPYEGISEDTYRSMASTINRLDLQGLGDSDKLADLYCDGAACAVPTKGA